MRCSRRIYLTDILIMENENETEIEFDGVTDGFQV